MFEKFEMFQILPGIKRIGYINNTDVPSNVVAQSLAGITLTIYVTPVWLCLAGTPRCEYDDDYDNKANYQKGTLQFTCGDILPRTGLSFIVETVEGEMYLYGQKEVPCLINKLEKSTGAPSSSAAGYDYKAVFKARKVLLPCLIQ